MMEKPRHAKGISSDHGGYYDGGYGTYWKEIEDPDTEICQIYVGGVQGITDVQFNQHHVGMQVNGYMPFTLDVSDLLCTKNELVFFVNKWGLPSDRWYAGAELNRTVEMLTAPRVYIPWDRIYTYTLLLSDESAVQRFEVNVQGGQGDVMLRIEDAHGDPFCEKTIQHA